MQTNKRHASQFLSLVGGLSEKVKFGRCFLCWSVMAEVQSRVTVWHWLVFIVAPAVASVAWLLFLRIKFGVPKRGRTEGPVVASVPALPRQARRRERERQRQVRLHDQ
jgi:hypothetical protein